MPPANLLIRKETPEDIDAINEITIAAFNTLEISEHTEQFVVKALRNAGVLILSMVAELDGEVVGHIAFSPITISDGTPDWYGVGPLTVKPEIQRTGVGSALMWEGLAQMHAMRAKGCCLVGHPEYYRKFGFINPDGLSMEGVPPEVFFALSFDNQYPLGQVSFHEAFFVTE
jgi:putative acetyltransferase